MSASPQLRLHPRPAYLTLALTAVQRAIAYRMTLFFSLVAGLIWVVVTYYLWRVVFSTRSQVGNFDWQTMRTYFLVSYAVNALLSWQTLSRMMRTIRTGEVAIDLLRPIDYFLAQLAQASGAAVIEGGLSSAIALILGILVLHIAPPVSPLATALFIVSVALGYLIKFLISFMVALLCFWTLNGVGLMWAQNALVNLFSGALIPLQLLPGWLRTVVLTAPFQAIVYTPLSIYLGTVQGAALWQAVAVQIGWIIGLWLLARWLWLPATRALEVQGG